jgi:hypothetical protein
MRTKGRTAFAGDSSNKHNNSNQKSTADTEMEKYRLLDQAEEGESFGGISQ